MRPSFCKKPSPIRGRRECRVHAAPAVSCASCTENAHTSIQVQRRQSGLPCAMVLQLIPCSPRRDQSLFVTVVPRKRELPENLTPAIGASGPHDFAVRERLRSSFASSTSTASHRACRDVRNAPLIGRDGFVLRCIGYRGKAEYFSREDWTGFCASEVICPTGCFVAPENDN